MFHFKALLRVVIVNTVKLSSVKFGKTELDAAAVQPLYGGPIQITL